jgi:hypothetical protein
MLLILSFSSSTCSSSTTHPPLHRQSQRASNTTSPTLASVRDLGSRPGGRLPSTIVENGYDIPQRMPKSVQVPAPALPPKPAARIKPQRSLATETINQRFVVFIICRVFAKY